MANDIGCRCGHVDTNERKNCFAYRGGTCDALKENCRYHNGKCKFYKTKEQVLKELHESAKRLDYSFDDYIESAQLKSFVAILLK